ncbi:fimbrial protein [Collimonas sp.]|jgi:major type 1 subunit fimbrin (pilin)|uniref:fimbrial protein n=1 Tax=Collimonas sp. TaxID=1963772 RepID=UPI002BA81CE6|nr:fimbrial protein [Collimonas sp.]HWW07799.1 fimbrial protein [Collimonas sp.]
MPSPRQLSGVLDRSGGILPLLCALLLFPLQAAAMDCGDTVHTIATLPAVKIAADAPVGAILWSRTGAAFDVACSTSIFSWAGNTFLRRRDLRLTQYGLELLLTYKGDRGSEPATIATGIYADGNVHITGNVDIELRKTGATPTQGNVANSEIMAFGIDGDGDNNKGPHKITGLNNISFVNYTCSVDSSSLNKKVPMGDMRVDKFTGIGSTSPNIDFSIGLTCSQPAGSYSVAIKFDATADASKAPGVLALDGGAGAATGVGIQLLMDKTPVTFGTPLSAGSATAGATLAVPLTARYYQTADKVQPGKANGIATFTISYK